MHSALFFLGTDFLKIYFTYIRVIFHFCELGQWYNNLVTMLQIQFQIKYHICTKVTIHKGYCGSWRNFETLILVSDQLTDVWVSGWDFQFLLHFLSIQKQGISFYWIIICRNNDKISIKIYLDAERKERKTERVIPSASSLPQRLQPCHGLAQGWSQEPWALCKPLT